MKQKFLTLMTLLLCAVMGAWADDIKPTITGVEAKNVPAVPTATLDLSTQTEYESDKNGWIVGYTKGVVDNKSWWGKTQTNGGSTSWTAPQGTVAPFKGGSSTNRYTLNIERCHALRFTGAEKFSILTSYSSSDSRSTGVILYTIDGTTLTAVGGEKTTTSNPGEIVFENLSSSTNYVAYIYAHGASGKNTDFFEFALKAPDKTVTSKVLTGININGAAWDINGLSENAATISTAYTSVPEVEFVYTINYDDSSYDEGQTETVTAVKSGDNYVAASTVLTNNVTLTFTNVSVSKQDAGLAYATSSVTKKVPGATFTNALTNPNSVAVTYSITSNGTGSTVNAETGEVTVGKTSTGTETITATFAGSDLYNAGTATYSLVVAEGSAQTTVSETTTWNWANVSPNTQITNDAKPTFVLVDEDRLDFTNFGGPASAIKLIDCQRPMMTSNSKNCAQAGSFTIITTEAGTITIEASGNNTNKRALLVNSVIAKEYEESNIFTTEAISVPAGTVTAAFYEWSEGDNAYTSATLGRIYSITFTKAAATVAVTGVTVDETAEVEVGKTVTLTATVAPVDATNKSVTWTSSDEDVATVDGGVVTGVAAGTATITVTTVDGSFTATCTVTVVAAQAPIVTLPTARDGYSVTSGGSAASSSSYSRDPLNGETLYTLNKNSSYTLTIPGTTNVSKISIIGVTDDNSTTSTVTITGANSQTANATFVVRKSENPTTLDFIPSSQTTTYTIAISNDKNVAAKIAVYGEEAASQTITTNVAGWTSYTPVRNATLSADAKAYYVTGITSSTVIATAVTKLAAGKGYFVKGANSTEYTATFTIDEADATTGTMLVPVLVNTTINGDTAGQNFVLGHNDDGAGLYKVDSNVTVAAGKAYLSNTGTEVSARFLSLDFDEESTGISATLMNNETMSHEVYNLAGQRVAQPQKGLYIMNGRKVVLK